MKVIKPPRSLTLAKLYRNPIIFLAGSIEKGEAEDWQTTVTKQFEQDDVTIINPRRDDWDSSWHQDIENDQFAEQVSWELEAMKISDYIIMHFEPDTKSPITLLELGLNINTFYECNTQLIVHCPEGFWRKGNVDIVCKTYGIKQVDEVDQLVHAVRQNLRDEKKI